MDSFVLLYICLTAAQYFILNLKKKLTTPQNGNILFCCKNCFYFFLKCKLKELVRPKGGLTKQ